MTPLRDILVRFGSEGLVRLCGLVSFPLLARSLGADGYGVVIGTGAIAGLAMAGGGLGLSFHVARLLQGADRAASARLLRSLLLITLAAGAGLALLVATCSPWLAQAFMPHPAAAAALVAVAASIVCGAADGVLHEWLRARHRFAAISGLQAGQALLQLAAILVTVLLHGGVVAVVAVVAISQAARLAVVYALLRRAGELTSPGLLARADLFRLVINASPVLTATLGGWVLTQGIRLVVGNRLDATALGAFGAAALIATGIGMIGSACWLPLYPRLARSVAHGHKGMTARACRSFGRFFHLASIPALALGAVLGGVALRCLAGSSFPEVDLACVLLLASAYVEMAGMPWSYVVSAHGDAAHSRNAILLGCALNLGLAVILTPLAGIAGAAGAVLAGQCATAAMNARTVASLGHRPLAFLPWPELATAAAAALPAVLAALLLRHEGWGGLGVAGGAGVMVYAAVLALLRRRPMLRSALP